MLDFVAPFINVTEIQIMQRAVDNSLIINGGGIGMGSEMMYVFWTERGERNLLWQSLVTWLWTDFQKLPAPKFSSVASLQSSLQFSFFCSLFVFCFQSMDKFHKCRLMKKVIYGNPVPERKALHAYRKEQRFAK